MNVANFMPALLQCMVSMLYTWLKPTSLLRFRSDPGSDHFVRVMDQTSNVNVVIPLIGYGWNTLRFSIKILFKNSNLI